MREAHIARRAKFTTVAVTLLVTLLLVVPAGVIAYGQAPDPLAAVEAELAAAVADYRFEAADVEAALAVPDADLVAAVAQLASPALLGTLSPVWFTQDAASVRAMLSGAFDAESGRFTRFATAHPAFDETLARLYVEGFLAASFLRETHSQAANEALVSLLTTGELPPGFEWAYEDTAAAQPAAPAAAPAASPSGAAPSAAPAPDAAAVALESSAPVAPGPLSAGPASVGGGADALDNAPNSDQHSFFITDCGLCDVGISGSSPALVATFDLGDIDPESVEEVKVSAYAYDVDWFVADPCGSPIEVDMVYLNGQTVDHLVGANNQWSLSEMNANPAALVPGVNTVSIKVDTAGNGCWVATVDWVQVDVNAPKGDVRVREVETDKDGYNLGEDVEIKATVYTIEDATPDPYPASVQFNIYDPTGAIPVQTTQQVSIPGGSDKEVTVTLTIPQSVQAGVLEPGDWTVAAIAFDKEGKRSDTKSTKIGVGTDVKIDREGVKTESKGTNPRNSLTKIEVTPTWTVASAVDVPQSYTVVIEAIVDGSVVGTRTQTHTIPGKVSGESVTGDAVEFNLDLKKKPTVRVVLDKANAIKEIKESNNEAEKELAEPEIIEIHTKFLGNFLEALQVSNEYWVEVQDPGVGEPVTRVKYTIEDEFGAPVREMESSARGTGFKITLDMGSITPGIYKISAVAITGDGVESKPKSLDVTIWSKPFLLLSLAAFPGFTLHALAAGNKIEYAGGSSIKFFTPEWRSPGGLLEKALCGGGGGGEYTGAKFTLELTHSVLSTSASWSIGVAGSWEFQLAGKGMTGGVGGSGTWMPGDPSYTWDLRKIAVSYGLVFNFSCDVLGFIVNKFPVVGWIADYVLSLQLTLDVGLIDGSIEFVDKGQHEVLAGLAFEKADGTLGVKLGAGPVIGPSWANIGFSVSGGAGFTLGYDSAGFGLKKISGCTGGCKFKLTGSFIWVSGTILEATLIDEFLFYGSAAEARVFATLARDYVVEGYGTFAGGEDGVLVGGVAPFAKPALAANAAGAAAAAWTVDDASRERPASVDVVVSLGDADGFAAPETVAASALVEFSPVVAVGDDGRVLVVWHVFADELTLEDNPFDHLDRVDLRAAVRDPATGAWSDEVRLTQNGAWELEPRVAALPGGGFAVAWLEDADGRFETTADRALRAATSPDGETFAAHQDIADGLIVGAPALAGVPGLGAAVAWIDDADADPATRDDRTVRVAAGAAGAVWPASVAVAGPGPYKGVAVAAAAAAGGVVVAWQRDAEGERAVEATTLAAAAGGALAPDTPVRLAGDGNATVGLPVLHARAGAAPVLTYLGYDAGEATLRAVALGADLAPSEPRTLVSGALVDVAAALAGGDRVLAAAVAPRGDGGFDLLLEERAMRPDLAVASVATAPANPAPATPATLVAAVENRGDVASEAGVVVFRVDGVPVGTAPLAALPPGGSALAEAAWLVPPVNSSHLVEAQVVAAGDGDAANDAASLLTTLPNLRLAALETFGGERGLLLRATVANDGAQASAATVVAFSDGSGRLLAEVPLPALEPGQAAAAEATVPERFLTPGALVVRAEARQSPDFDASDNVADARAEAAPDLAVVAVDAADAHAGRTHVTATVANVGSHRSAETTAVLLLDGAPVASASVPALRGGRSADVRLDFVLPAGAHEAQVLVDPNGVVALDGNRANNRAGAGVVGDAAPSGEPAVTAASVRYTSAGVEIEFVNRGNSPVAFAPFALYNGYPQEPPKFGLLYATKVRNLLYEGSVADVPAHGSRTVLVPTADAKLNQVGALGQLFVRVDPFGALEHNDPSDDVAGRPLVAAVSTTHPDPTVAYTSNAPAFRITTSPTISASGFSVVLDRSPGTVPPTTVTTTSRTLSYSGLADGDYWLHVRATYGWSAWTPTDHLPVRIRGGDVVAPETTLRLGGTSFEDAGVTFVGDDVPFTLVATDPSTATSGTSGVARTEYAIDGAWRVYAGPFTVPVGAHTVAWRSVDAAGNAEVPQARRIHGEADTHAPETTLTGVTLVEGGGAFVAPGSLLTLDATDPAPYVGRVGSGVALSEYRVDAGAWTTYAGPFALPASSGSYALQYRSVDAAGNAEAARSLTVTVDGDPPAAAVTSHASGDPVVGTVTFTVDASDALSGVARVELWRDGVLLASADEPSKGGYALTVDTGFWTFGNNDLEFRTTDRVGNEATTPLTVYAVTRQLAVWKDPAENLDRYAPVLVRGRLPI